MGAVIAGNVNNVAPAKLTRANAKVKTLSLLAMTTLRDLEAHEGPIESPHGKSLRRSVES
jgi:hypothetical protein